MKRCCVPETTTNAEVTGMKFAFVFGTVFFIQLDETLLCSRNYNERRSDWYGNSFLSFFLKKQ